MEISRLWQNCDRHIDCAITFELNELFVFFNPVGKCFENAIQLFGSEAEGTLFISSYQQNEMLSSQQEDFRMFITIEVRLRLASACSV